jgi:PA14 domain-containing protein/galactose oxidase-like protein
MRMTNQDKNSQCFSMKAVLLSCLVSASLMSVPEVLAQPSSVGQWSAAQNWSIVSVHCILLPTGKVMFYPYNDDPRLWDPANNSITLLPKVGYNIFCTGHSFLTDGRVLITGGHVQNGWGLNDASYYNPFNNTWTRLPDMNNGRWYPSGTTLPNGDQLVTSGSYDTNYSNNTLPQVWQVSSSTWRNLTSAQLGLPLYPRTFVAPNGRVFFATSTSRYLDTAGAGSWSTVGNTIFGGRDNYGSAAMYEPGKVLWAGGGDPPTATAERIDLNAGTPAWASTGSMPGPRRQNNLTILPDGRVLCTGGSAAAGFNTEDGGKAAVVWNPANGTWSTWATEVNYRGYHSTALLLPDGRVLSSGGDNHPNAEIFSPPYLFNGTRPSISSAPGSGNYGQTIFVGTPEATSITKVTLTRISSVTHAQNWDQRFLNLGFSQASGGLNVVLPSSANIAPPGHYLLWILNGSGVPSVSRWLQLVPGGGGGGTGLNGEYYDAINFTQRKVTRTDGTVNFDWVSGSPDPSIGADTFSVRWTGQVQPQFSETYTFYTRTDDGVRLWVNGSLLVDKWIDQGPTEWSGTIALTGGTKYNIQMDYYENGGGAVAQLSWSSPSQAKQIIPQSRLFTTFSGIPKPWTSQDIGAVAAAGSSSYSVGNWTVVGSGADIWNNADEFRFVHQTATGDCEMIARVTGVQNTDPWAKAGVMIRETLTAGSRHAYMALTSGNGLAFQRRTATDGISEHTSGGAASAPRWVRVARVGSTFTGYSSTDGLTWTTVGSATITMGTTVYIGLAVTSHLDGTLNTSTFDNVSAAP